MKHIVFDCDNTFGVPNCDVDDGLAMIYLMGCQDACLHGVTATYGNNELETVYRTIRRMLSELNREDIVLKKGGSNAGDYESEASKYLARMAKEYQGELSILATGSLTNLMGAYQEDSHFFEYVKEIVLMGGITKPLVFEKKVMDELNFSCDPKATYTVLTKGKNVSVITGNNCLKVLFTKEEYKERLFANEKPIAKYIREETDYWFGYNEQDYGIHGFYNWDVTAAVFLMHPEQFANQQIKLSVSETDLARGYLRTSSQGNCNCNLPVILKEDSFKRNIYQTWFQVQMTGEGQRNDEIK
ncbi:nucleoside hydrolase [Lachnospiraceae bacterium LCP25S3_G4]